METTATSAQNRPAVSVIVPVYNAEKTLRRCLDSLLAQRFSDLELLVVDDGSTDSSAAICKEYASADPRVRLCRKENGGVSSARNLGLKEARGEFIAFCDSDDCAGADWLSSLYDAIGDSGMAVGGYVRTEPSGAEVIESAGKSCTMVHIPEILEKLLGARLLQFVWNKLFRKSVIDRAGLSFDESFRIFEDEYFVLNYLSADHTVSCVPQCHYRYFLPEGFYSKYDFGLDAFRKVTEAVEYLLGRDDGKGRSAVRREKVRLPALVYWYKIALGRYACSHTFAQSRVHIRYARHLARRFHDGDINHLSVRVLPERCIYMILKRKQNASMDGDRGQEPGER